MMSPSSSYDLISHPFSSLSLGTESYRIFQAYLSIILALKPFHQASVRQSTIDGNDADLLVEVALKPDLGLNSLFKNMSLLASAGEENTFAALCLPETEGDGLGFSSFSGEEGSRAAIGISDRSLV